LPICTYSHVPLWVGRHMPELIRCELITESRNIEERRA
jgi:hypothetical protein